MKQPLVIAVVACLALMPGAMRAQTISAAAAAPPAGSAGAPRSCGEATGPTACGASGPASKSDKTVSDGGGNPINVITGNKYQREVDLPALPGVLGLELVRHYNSQFSGLGFPNGIMGRGWKLSYETELYVVGRTLQIVQADGARLIFSRDLLDPSHCGTSRVSDGRIAIRRGPHGDEYVWTWPDGRRLSFDHRGKLVQIAVPTGEFVTLQHDAGGHLVQVTDPQGRQLKLNYAEPARGQGQPARFTGVQSIDTPVGRYVYKYGSPAPKGTQVDKIQLVANLVKVHLPTHYEADKPAHPLTSRGTTSSSVSRTYHYEDARFPTLLTGISVSGSGSDGQAINQRLSTYGYDQRGWAVFSEHGGLKVELAVLERASLSELPGSTPGRSVLVHGRTAERPEGRRLEIRSAMVAGDYRITETRGEPCAQALPCPRANMRYRYDVKGRLIEEIQLDPQGQPLLGVRTAYDPMDRAVSVSQVLYKAGKAGAERWMVRYEYGATGEQPTLIARPSVVPGREHQWRLSYNDRGQVLRVEEQGYSPLDAQGQPIERPDQATPIMRATSYGYGRINGRSVLVVVNGPLAGSADTTYFRWDGAGDHIQAIRSPGDHAMKVLQRDAAGRTTRIAEDDGSRYRETITHHDHLGHVLARDVVAWSRQGGVLNSNSRLSLHTGFDYDAQGRLTAIHNADGTLTRTEFGANGRPSTLILPDGGRIALQRDAAGSLSALTRLDDQQRALQTVRFSQDDALRLTGLGDELGQLLTLRYGPGPSADQPSEVEHPEGVKTSYAYDELGFITEQVRAVGADIEQRTRWQHDAGGHVIRIDRASTQSAVYDDFGRKLLQHDASHGLARYVWDAADRLIARVDATLQVQRYDYDTAGRLISSGVGDKITLMRRRYDGSLASETTAFDAQGHAGEHKQWRYDSLGRLIEERHQLPNADAEAEPLPFVTTLAYDARGRLAQRTLIDSSHRAHRLSYAWDDHTGHLSGITYNDQPVVTDLHASWLAGIGAFTHGNGITERFERDARGRLIHHTVQADPAQKTQATAPAILDQRYTYDGANRLVAATQGTTAQRGEQRYGYDQLGRLVSAQNERDRAPDTYAYDSEGNRIRSTIDGEGRRYTYAGQQLLAIEPTARRAGWASMYSALGEPWTFWSLQSKDTALQSGAGQKGQAEAHKLDKAVTVHKPAVRTIYAPGGPALAVVDEHDRQVARYGWGLRGERISKTTTLGEHRTTTYYLYQDASSRPVVADTRDLGLQLYAEADESGRVRRQYVYLDGLVVASIDTPGAHADAWHSAWERLRTAIWSWFDRVPPASGDIYAVHADQRHAPVAVSDAQGMVIWHARYEAFGLATINAIRRTRTTSSSGLMREVMAADYSPAAYEFNLRLPGQYWDAERTTHYSLHRDYDPTTGRFTTPDPLSMLAGMELGQADRLAGSNVYAYVSNTPLTQIDAQGLYQEDIHYYMTFFLALAAGVDYNDARTIALAAQYIDDNPATRPLDAKNYWTMSLSTLENQPALLSYHFVLSDRTGIGGDFGMTPALYDNDNLLLPTTSPSFQLKQLIGAYQKAPTRCAKLQFFGEFLHAFEDTFGHRASNNTPIDALRLGYGLGHGIPYGEHPDYTYNHTQTVPLPVLIPGVPINLLPTLELPVARWNNEARTLTMEQAVYDWIRQKSGLTNQKHGVSWGQIEEVLRKFNATQENHNENGTSFAVKLDVLNRALATFVKRPDGSNINLLPEGKDKYIVTEAEKNRRINLCDGNGNRLRQSDYPLLILPQSYESCK